MVFPALLLLASAAGPAKPSVSVLYFENRTSDPELQVLGKGLADMIITDLVAWDGVTVVERQRLDDVLKELQLQRTKAFDPSTAARVGKLVGAQYAITGSLHLQKDQLRIDAAVVRIETSETIASASVTDSKDRVFDLEQQLVEKLVTAIDVKLNGSSARQKAKVPDFDALVAYSKAIDLSDQGKHDEASKAMTALVSKSPTFLMARERKQELLDKLKEFEARKKDLVSSAVLEVGKRADAELKKKGPSPMWRVLKGRYLMRLMKQSLSFRDGHLRVAKPGEEPKVLSLQRQWVENQRALIEENDSGSDPDLERSTVYELIRDSGLHPDRTVRTGAQAARRELIEFVLRGRATDGETFQVAPALGVMDSSESERILAENARAAERLEQAWSRGGGDRRQVERELMETLSLRGDLLEHLRRDDEAAQVYQKMLDLFPTQATSAERRIQKIIGAVHDNDQKERDAYERLVRGACSELGSEREAWKRLRRKGLAGLDEVVQEVEAACLGRFGMRGRWESFYSSVARTAAQHEDCARAERYHRRAFLFGSASVRGFESLPRLQGWCTYRLGGDALPPKFKFRATGNREVSEALTDLLGNELLARGVVAVIGEDNSGGELEFAHAEVQPDRSVSFVIMRRIREGNIERGSYETMVTVPAKDGALDVDALLKPLLAEVTPMPEPLPWKPSPSLSWKTIEAYAAALKAFDKRQWAEAKAAFEAIAAAEPSLHAAKSRAGMAAEKLGKEKR